MCEQKLIQFGANNIVSAAQATLYGEHGHTASDLISSVGFTLVFPEVMHSTDINEQVVAFISLGTTLDNVADEGPGVDSYDVGKCNREQFDYIRNMLMENYNIHPNVLKNAGGFLRQCWVVEEHAHIYDRSYSPQEQKEYRELINAIWTRTYVSFLMGITDNTIDYYGNVYSPEFANGLPTFDELTQQGRETYETIKHLYRDFINGKYEGIPQGASAYALYLLVMETSNWYDTQLNTKTNLESTPRLREHTNEYRKKLALLGISLPITRGIFLAAKIAMTAMQTKHALHKRKKQSPLVV